MVRKLLLVPFEFLDFWYESFVFKKLLDCLCLEFFNIVHFFGLPSEVALCFLLFLDFCLLFHHVLYIHLLSP